MSGPAIALIGPMGAGKTSIGRRVAKHLSRRFVDTDAAIAAEHGPIPALFRERGEGAFREIERQVVRRELADGGVVALGGGAVLDPGTQQDLRDCTVVLLTVDEQAVRTRLAGGRRPLLVEGAASWRAIAETRAPLYAALADVTVDTSRRPMTTIAAELADRLRALAPSGADGSGGAA